MNIWMRIGTAILILLIASNALPQDLTGYWDLHVTVTGDNPPFDPPFNCLYEDPSLFLSQSGTLFTGTASLSLISGDTICHPSIPFSISFTPAGIGIPVTAITPYDPLYGEITTTGALINSISGSGTFESTWHFSGTWTSNKLYSSTAVPTMTEWGMIILIVLIGLGAIYYLRRRRAIQCG